MAATGVVGSAISLLAASRKPRSTGKPSSFGPGGEVQITLTVAVSSVLPAAGRFLAAPVLFFAMLGLSVGGAAARPPAVGLGYCIIYQHVAVLLAGRPLRPYFFV